MYVKLVKINVMSDMNKKPLKLRQYFSMHSKAIICNNNRHFIN